jgi:hypothetical protein
MARSLISTIFPFQASESQALINFPAINDDMLQGLKTVPFMEILHSKFYASSPSPYATILSKNSNTFENFIFSSGNYDPPTDTLINTSQNLEHAGWAILRSGHNLAHRKKIMAFMDYGPYGGNNHGHADRFNIILFSNYDSEFKQLIGDIGNLKKSGTAKLGYYNSLHNRYVRSTISHNTILINNNRQADPNREVKTKSQPFHPLYKTESGDSSEISFANKKCISMSFDPDNSDSVQYIYASSGYNSSFGPDYSVDRTMAMIADKYIVDIVNIDKKPEAELHFIDWIIRGPNSHLLSDQNLKKALQWDWERGAFNIPYPNDSYNYLYDVDTSNTELGEIWQSYWTKSTSNSDTLLHIYGVNTGDQKLIRALSPDSTQKYQINPNEIKANIITRKYSISGDWKPEFLSVIQPAGVTPIETISFSGSELVIRNKEEKEYIFDIQNLELR